MIGWLILFGLGILALLLLWRPGRLDRPALMLAAAALFIAAAGYAWQGSPGELGAPKQTGQRKAMRPETLFATERQRFLNHYGQTGIALGEADAMNRLGEDDYAVGFMRAAVTKYPDNPDLWIGYAHALFVLADGNFSPAVALALDRAQAIDPANPAPRYFRGVMAFEVGDPATAEREWRGLTAALPAASPWRPIMAERLGIFDAMRAGRMPGAGAGR